jgi:hypothetical protein
MVAHVRDEEVPTHGFVVAILADLYGASVAACGGASRRVRPRHAGVRIARYSKHATVASPVVDRRASRRQTGVGHGGSRLRRSVGRRRVDEYATVRLVMHALIAVAGGGAPPADLRPKCALRRLDDLCLVADQVMMITIAPTCSLRANIS